jgi:HD-GYP domain-containing protein (c-di-GMP phosphodiesterase class II)
MTSDRPYRKALSNDEALAELRRRAGIQFDPVLVEVFEKIVLEQNEQIRS